MAILRVAQMGHPVLRKVARDVTPDELASDGFQVFCDDMLETLEEYDGAGIAAPQVHASVRVVIATLSDQRGPEFFVNPKITVLGPTTRKTFEGCLSVEGLRGRVERPDHVLVEALDRDGSPKTMELRGHPAVVIQHECDHLDGVLYVDKVEVRTLAFLREYKKFGPLDEEEDDPAEELADFDDEVYGELTSEEFTHPPAE